MMYLSYPTAPTNFVRRSRLYNASDYFVHSVSTALALCCVVSNVSADTRLQRLIQSFLRVAST